MASKPKRHLVDPRAIPVPETKYVAAMKAITNGTANEHQQKLFMHWLINVACGYGEDCAFFGETEKTFYALGRRRVATLIKSYVATPIENFKDDPAD